MKYTVKKIETWPTVRLISKTKNDLWKVEFVGGDRAGKTQDRVNQNLFNIIPPNEEGIELGEVGTPHDDQPVVVADGHYDNSATKLKDPNAP